MLVSAPRAVIAMVRRNVSKLLMKPTTEAGSRFNELKPITAMNPNANHGMVICFFPPVPVAEDNCCRHGDCSLVWLGFDDRFSPKNGGAFVEHVCLKCFFAVRITD